MTDAELPPSAQPAYKRRPNSNWFPILVSIVICAAVGSLAILLYVQFVDIKHIETLDQATTSTYAIILGASLQPNGSPSDALADRVKTGVDLYNQKKVSKLLMSGDDGQLRSNEVAAMQKLALDEGVTSTDILIDGQGYRTYESCKRAKEVFHIDNAIVVSQRFHLPRALYLCENFGIQSQGVIADHQTYRSIFFFTIRDYAASLKAWLDINFIHPQPPV